MTERERICEQPPQGAITRPFVRPTLDRCRMPDASRQPRLAGS